MITDETIRSINIQRVLNRGSDSEGCDRRVYFVGDDLVLKDDLCGGGGANNREYDVYRDYKGFDGTFASVNGVTFTIRIPEMVMTNGYIIATRVKFPHIRDCSTCWHIRAGLCGSEQCAIVTAVSKWCDRNMELSDMHNYNFCWDATRREAWLVDIAD